MEIDLVHIDDGGMGPQAAIVDIDGTLAIRNGRSPFDYSSVLSDIPNMPVVTTVLALQSQGIQIIAVSGREDKCRLATAEWLQRHLGFSPVLYMRRSGDYRPDFVVKEEIYRQEIVPQFDVLLVLDDRTQTVDMWRKLGLTTFQVAQGNF